jgi:hypothetical protein
MSQGFSGPGAKNLKPKETERLEDKYQEMSKEGPHCASKHVWSTVIPERDQSHTGEYDLQCSLTFPAQYCKYQLVSTTNTIFLW